MAEKIDLDGADDIPKACTEYIERSHLNATGNDGILERVSDSTVEKRLRRKFDLRILPLGILLYFSAFIDRSNMGNTRLLGLETDIDLGGDRFNIILSCFFITYIIFDIPCNIACKKVGPRLWLPFLVIGFGLITMCIAFANSYAALAVIRTLLGIFEAGLLPGVQMLFRRYYRRHEIATRNGILSAITSLSGAFGGLLAYGFSEIPKSGMMQRWRWVFLLEGILTMLFGVTALIFLSDKPASASWLSGEEREVAAERIASEQKTHSHDPVDLYAIKSAIFQPPTQLVALALTASLCCMNSVALFMVCLRAKSTLASMPVADRQCSRLSCTPPYAWGAVVCIMTAMLSDRLRNRGYILMGLATCIIAGFAILATVDGVGARYFAIFLATTGGFCGSPLLLSWAADNAAGPAVHAVVIAYVISIGSLGALVSTWAYQRDDAPRYVPGHLVNLGFG